MKVLMHELPEGCLGNYELKLGPPGFGASWWVLISPTGSLVATAHDSERAPIFRLKNELNEMLARLRRKNAL